MKRSPLIPIFLIVATDVLGLTIVIPLLPFYAEKYGASPIVVGWLVASYALCQLFAGPMLGRISDRVGRRPLLLVSQVGTLIGFIILARAESLFWIFVARIIDGITAGNLSLAQAYISDVSAPENRAKAFGVIGISFGLGFLIGPAISGFLAQYGYHYPVWAAAGLSFLSIIATYFLLPKGRPPQHEHPDGEAKRRGIFEWNLYAQYFRRPELTAFLIQFSLFALSFSLFVSGFALFSERRFSFGGQPYGPREVGYLFAYAGLLGMFIQGGLIGRLVKRFGEEKLSAVGFILAGMGYALLGFAHHLPMLILASTVASFGSSFLRPCLTSLVSRRAHRHEQGVVLGLTQSLNSLAQIAAPALSGLLIEYDLLSSWAFVTASVAFAGNLVWLRHASASAAKATGAATPQNGKLGRSNEH